MANKNVQKRILKAMMDIGRETDIKEIQKRTGFTYESVRGSARHLVNRGLIKRRVSLTKPNAPKKPPFRRLHFKVRPSEMPRITKILKELRDDNDSE